MLFALCSFSEAQQPERIPRIGYLPSAGAPIPRQLKAFQEGLRDLGYVEGKNIVIESRHSDGKFEPTDLVKELLQLKVDILIAVDPTSVRAAKQATKNVPIVMVTNQDPVATGLVDDLARPERKRHRDCPPHSRPEWKKVGDTQGDHPIDFSRRRSLGPPDCTRYRNRVPKLRAYCRSVEDTAPIAAGDPSES